MAKPKEIRLSIKDMAEFFAEMKPRHFYNPALEKLYSSLQLDFSLFVSKKRNLNAQDIYKELIDAIENCKKGI